MNPNVLIVICILVSLMALILSTIAISQHKKVKPDDYLELKNGDLVLIEKDKVILHRFGALPVQETIEAGEDDDRYNTITFKAGRTVKKVKIF